MAITLTKGTNTYVTVADADSYIADHYLPTDSVALAWFNLSTQEKGIYLLRSAKEIEHMRYTGYVSTTTQTMAFPRNGDLEVPDAVEEAQIINALVLSTVTTNLTTTYGDPLSRGVKRYSIDDFEEEYFRGVRVESRLTSDEAIKLLIPWTYGGYAIR